MLSRDWVWGMLVRVLRNTLQTHTGYHPTYWCCCVSGVHMRAVCLRDSLWVAVDLLQVLGQAGCRGHQGPWGQQVPLLQQVHHPESLGGLALQAQPSQGGAQLGSTGAGTWARWRLGDWSILLTAC